MAFATLSNGSPATTTAGGGSTSFKKIGQRITFPNIEGRDAPGKTGNAAKPALVTALGFYLTSSAGAKLRFCIWDSTGSRVSPSSEYTPVAGIDKVNLQSSVFSGTEYIFGFALTSTTPTATFTFGNLTSGRDPRYDTRVWDYTPPPTGVINRIKLPASATTFIDSGAAAPGPMNYEIDYDVLPTAPLNLATTLLTPSNPTVQLDWDAVASDGGQSVSGYRVQISTDNITWTTLVANTGSTSRTYTTSELVFGTTYYFRVAAINLVATSAGSDYSGPYSATASATIAGAVAGNAQSFLTATVDNPDPVPVVFTDFGPGIRFTQIDVQYGAEYLYNEIQATTQDSFAELQISDAPQSKALYGVRTYSLTNLLNSTDLGAFEVAKDYLTYYYQPELRVQSITVDLSNLTIEEKLQVLALEIDSFISVSFTPNGIGDPKIASGLVTGIAHRISITTHEVELRLRNERNLFTLDSDSKGILDVNILGP
jgi:hypothetical protein